MASPDEMGLTPEAARGYEQFFVPSIFHQWPPLIAAKAEIQQGDNVLDVGCGTGALTREVARYVGAAGSVAGLDLSESMLGVARETCPGADFRLGSAIDLPHDDASFDAVVSSFMLMFVPDPTKAISEMRRVLRPGGRLVVSVWQSLDTNPAYAALVAATQAVAGAESAQSVAWPFTMGEAGRLSEIFKSSGMPDAMVSEHDGTAVFPSVEEFVRTEIQAWLLADSVDEKGIELIIAELRSRYPGFGDTDGPIEFPLNAILVKYRVA